MPKRLEMLRDQREDVLLGSFSKLSVPALIRQGVPILGKIPRSDSRLH